jgi:hypothetical protein
MDKSTKSEKKYGLGGIPAISAMESTTNTENLSLDIYDIDNEVNAVPKSRVRENRKHGSAGEA